MPISQDQITTLDQLEEKLTLALTDLLLLRDSNNEDYKVKASTILQAAVDKAGAELIGGNVESGNNKAITGNEVANIMSSLPNDAVLHYSFDDVPDIPDGTADVRLLDNNTYDIQSTNYKFRNNNGTIFSAENGNLKCSITGGSFTGCYIPASVIQNKIVKIRLKVTDIVGTLGISIDAITSGNIKSITENGVYDVLELHPTASGNNQLFFWCVGEGNSCTFTVEQIYIGDGSYVTPIIDNVNGQNNGTNNGGIAVQGVSGKGVKLLDNSFVQGNLPWLPWNKVTFTMSCWVNWDKSQILYLFNNWSDYSISTIKVELSDSTDKVGIDAVSPYNEYTLQRFFQRSIDWNNIDTTKMHVVVIFDATNTKLFINGVQYSLIRQNIVSWNQNSKTRQFFYIGKKAADGGGFNYSNTTIDDFQIFDRALTEAEVMALYLNKANTSKYYNRADWKLEQIEAAAEE